MPHPRKCQDGQMPRSCPGEGDRAQLELTDVLEEYISSGHDKNIIDPDRDQTYTKRKERQKSYLDCGFPTDGWSSSLLRMPMFTRAEMNMHILKSGKHIDPHSKSHSVPTSMRKAKTFLEDEYLNGLSVASDQVHFFFKSKCHHSFRKNDPRHNLKVALDLVSGEVKNACTCVAGQLGFCNHVLALLVKICKLSLYGCKDVSELEEEDDMQPTKACTSTLQL